MPVQKRIALLCLAAFAAIAIGVGAAFVYPAPWTTEENAPPTSVVVSVAAAAPVATTVAPATAAPVVETPPTDKPDKPDKGPPGDHGNRGKGNGEDGQGHDD